MGATTPAANVITTAVFPAESTGGGSGRKAVKGRGRGKGGSDEVVKSTGSGKDCLRGVPDDSAEGGFGGQGTERTCGDDDVHDVGEAGSPSVAATTTPGLGLEVRFFDGGVKLTRFRAFGVFEKNMEMAVRSSSATSKYGVFQKKTSNLLPR